MSTSRRVAAVLAGATLISVVPALGASAVVQPGRSDVTAEVSTVRRVGGHLEVTFTLANHGADDAQVGYYEVDGTPTGTIDVTVVDPSTGREGAPLSDGTNCLCSKLPLFVEKGTGATSTVQVADPGGSSVNVLIGGFEPFLAVPVSGTGSASGGTVTTLKPRTLNLLSRVEDGATRTRGTSIDLDTDVLFAFDSAKLSPKADAQLDKAVKTLEAQPGRKIGVYGHTDGKGSSSYNQDLSEKRAQAVQKALAEKLGSGWTFEAKGFGETKPIAAETTKDGADYPAGRRLNRRVELAVLN